MALFNQDALNPGVKKREVFGWAMYDFANSGYTTVVITAVFAAYFVGGIAKGADWATFAWTAALSISYAIVMLTMPSLGAYADLRAAKKKLLVIFTIGCVVSTAALALAGPGSVALAFVLIVVSNTFFSYGESMTAAFLPELAKPEGMGKVSGWGWSFGYFGGMLALGICLGYVIWAGGRGIKADSFVPVTMLITAVIYGAAALVTFKLLKERAVPNPAAMGQSGMKASLVQLKKTFHEARRYPDFMWLLLCAVFYQGGVAVAITLAAIYAEQVIGFVQQETMVLIFVLNFAAAAGAFGLGYLQDRIGHKRALVLWMPWLRPDETKCPKLRTRSNQKYLMQSRQALLMQCPQMTCAKHWHSTGRTPARRLLRWTQQRWTPAVWCRWLRYRQIIVALLAAIKRAARGSGHARQRRKRLHECRPSSHRFFQHISHA